MLILIINEVSNIKKNVPKIVQIGSGHPNYMQIYANVNTITIFNPEHIIYLNMISCYEFRTISLGENNDMFTSHHIFRLFKNKSRKKRRKCRMDKIPFFFHFFPFHFTFLSPKSCHLLLTLRQGKLVALFKLGQKYCFLSVLTTRDLFLLQVHIEF